MSKQRWKSSKGRIQTRLDRLDSARLRFREIADSGANTMDIPNSRRLLFTGSWHDCRHLPIQHHWRFVDLFRRKLRMASRIPDATLCLVWKQAYECYTKIYELISWFLESRMNTCGVQYDDHVHLAGLPSALTGCNHCTWLCHVSGLFASATQAGHGWTWLDQAGPVALSHGHVEKQIILPSDRRGEALIHLPSTWWVWGIPALNWANIYIMYSICPKVSDKVNIFDSFHFSVARLNSVSSTSAVSHLDQTHISYESWQLWSWIWNPLLGMTPKHFNFQVTIGFGIIFHLC